MKIVLFCPDCEEILDENSSKICKAPTKIEGYKGNMHWYQAKYVDEVKIRQTVLEI
jgi:hypothetical protein